MRQGAQEEEQAGVAPMRALRVALAALSTWALLAVAAPSAMAVPGLPFVLTGSFDGSATPDGSFETTSVGLNQATGRVLVVDKAHSAVIQFDESGNPVNFTSTGTPKVPVNGGEIAVDNSGGASQGNFYVVSRGISVQGFAPSGAKLPGWPVPQKSEYGQLYSVAVGPDGNVWLGHFGNPYLAMEVSPAGTPTGDTIPIVGAKYFSFCDFCQSIAFDSHYNAWYTVEDGSLIRSDAANNYDGQKVNAVLGQLVARDVAIDPSTDDAFWNNGNRIAATKFTEPFVQEEPFEILPGLNTDGHEFSGDGQTLFATDAKTSINVFQRVLPQLPDPLGAPEFSRVKSESADVSGLVDTGGGGPATYHFEYGPDTNYGSRWPATDVPLPHTTFGDQAFSGLLAGLEPETVYHVRYVVTNATGSGASDDALIRTLPPGLSDKPDPCENALARKQTGAQTLADCRAYELVSAPYAGGYDVESPMVPGQTPFGGFPDADDRVLYGLDSGTVPGPWNPTNRGIDPYVAVRGENGWQTQYVGLPADLSPDKSSFSSVLGDADANLGTFAFAGPGLCDPCFSQSPETGIPLRRPDGQLVQAMTGTNPPASPDMKPEGDVAKMLSADGRHLVFGSKYALVAGANANNGNLNIYDRDLNANTTQLVSTTTGGAAMQAGAEISSPGLSADGSRVLIATPEATDSAGNEYVHLYMHIGTTAASVELAPAATAGVLFGGMTADGSKVFFNSSQALAGADTDSAPDLYEAAVAAGGAVTPRLVSVAAGAAPCNPVPNGSGAHWNSVGAGADCGAVAIGGGGGIARQSGTAYYLSPEALGGGAVANQPNLYAAPADGSAPRFVATLSPDDPVVVGSVHDTEADEGPEFQVSPNGRFATFRSVNELTGVDNAGNGSVFLHDEAASGGGLTCPSCNATLTEDPTMKAEATLAVDGLSLTDDGRVFFNTVAPLATEDTGGKGDVYEWVGGRTSLISSGIGQFDSELLTTTHDGGDAYFFTHDALDANVDENGDRTRVYDARTNGGFFKLPIKPQCAASDECHGPGTVAPGPPQIASSGRTSDGNLRACPKGKVKRKGRCVKKKKHSKKKTKRGGRRNG
jgi:hypothetical protein